MNILSQFAIETRSKAADLFRKSKDKPPLPDYKIMLANGKKALVVIIKVKLSRNWTVWIVILITSTGRF